MSSLFTKLVQPIADAGKDYRQFGSTEIDSVDTTDRYICLRISTAGGKTFGQLQSNITHMRRTTQRC